MVTEADVLRARGRIRKDIVRTPLEPSGPLFRLTGARVLVKWETDQVTGSFKFRGALNKIRSLSSRERRAGAITASTGNHGLGVLRAAGMERVPVVLYLPETAAPAKVARLKAGGASVAFRGSSCEKAEAAARRDAARSGRVFISPYNDSEVIAGQGTVGLEILEDCPDADVVFVPVGGGGLIGGIAAFLKSRKPGIQVIGVEPAASAFMRASLRAGRIVEIPEGRTLADAVAGGIEPGSVTLSLCRELVDGMVTVGEAWLKRALVLYGRHHGRRVEGAGALSLAACLKGRSGLRGKTVVLVASGGNIDPVLWRRVTGL